MRIAIADDAHFLVPMAVYEDLITYGHQEPYAELVTDRSGLPQLPSDQVLSSLIFFLTPEGRSFSQPILFFMRVACQPDHCWHTVNNQWQEVPIVYNESGWVGAEMQHFCSICASKNKVQQLKIKFIAVHLQNFDNCKCTASSPIGDLDVFISSATCGHCESEIASTLTRRDGFEYVRIVASDVKVNGARQEDRLLLSVGVGEKDQKNVKLNWNSLPVHKSFPVRLRDLVKRDDGGGYDLQVKWTLADNEQDEDKSRVQFPPTLDRDLPRLVADEDGKIRFMTLTASALSFQASGTTLGQLLRQEAGFPRTTASRSMLLRVTNTTKPTSPWNLLCQPRM